MTINPKLLEPTLLWSNPSPYLQFLSGDKTLDRGSMADYKTLIFEFRLGGSGNASLYAFAKYSLTDNVFYMSTVTNEYAATRSVSFTSATTLRFGSGYQGNTANNNRCVPIAIYGTNIL